MMDITLTDDEKKYINDYCKKHKEYIHPHICPTFMCRGDKYHHPEDGEGVCGLVYWCQFAQGILLERRRKYNACKTLYIHSKKMKDDPEALTDEFMEKMVGVSCDKLRKEKGDEK